MAFTIFTGKGKRTANKTISLNRSGGFTFSSGFCAKNDILINEYVILAFDSVKSQVGFIFSKEQHSPGALRLSKTPKSSPTSASIRSMPFIEAIKMNPEKVHGRYNVEQIFNKELNKPMFVIDLKGGKL